MIDDRFLAYLRDRLGNVSYAKPLTVLAGGFVTDVYTFELANAPDAWSLPLVLRGYPAGTEPTSVRRERCAQDVVSAQGVPAPRVLACEETPGVLDGPFMVMERLPGRPQLVIEFPRLLLEVPRLFTLPRRHAATMHMVHRLDATPLIATFEQAGIDRRAAGPEHWLDGAAATIDRWGFDGLRPGLEWLRSHRPDDPPRLSICHGDLFGANILERAGRVTGIIDWNLVTVADPAFDIGGQIAANEMSPMPGPAPLRFVSMGPGRLLARGLRGAYSRYATLSDEVVQYYAVMRAFTEMTYKLGAQARVRATGVSERMPTWRPKQCAAYFRRRTGVTVEI